MRNVTIEPMVERRGPVAAVAAGEPMAALILEDCAHLLDDLVEGAGGDVIEDESSDRVRGVAEEELPAFLEYLEGLSPEGFVDGLTGDPPEANFGLHESMPDYAERRAAAVAFVRTVKAAAPRWAAWVEPGFGVLYLRTEGVPERPR
jgi:hypothetical protein